MLNEVAVEGTVIGNSWRWSSDTLFRLGVDRDLLRSRKGSGPRDASDYFTVRASAQVLGVFPVQFRQGMRVRVHGFLQSREHEENLKAFLLRAHGPTGALAVGDETTEQITLTRVVTEIMAERIAIAPDLNRPSGAAEAAPKPRRSKTGGDAPPAGAEPKPEPVQEQPAEA
jgi:hypothetical protein